MSHPVYQVYAGDILPIFFSTYAGATGASVTLTGLAVTDIEIYKDASMTQRASDNGYTLIDTDGIDVDGITGIHGFSIDTGDNSDASFYTVGAWFTVVVSAVTVDAQTVNFIAAQFRVMPAESVAGKPKVDVDAFGGTAGTFASGRPEANTTHIAGSAVSTSTAQIGVNTVSLSASAITATSIASDAITAAKIADGAIDAATFAASAITATVIAADAITAAKIADGAIDAATFATGAITAAAIAADAIGASELAADAVTEIQSGLATSAALTTVSGKIDTVDDFLDTEMAAVLAAVDTEVAAIKAKTDSLTFTVAGQVDANIQAVNDVTVNGIGTAGNPWGP